MPLRNTKEIFVQIGDDWLQKGIKRQDRGATENIFLAGSRDRPRVAGSIVPLNATRVTGGDICFQFRCTKKSSLKRAAIGSHSPSVLNRWMRCSLLTSVTTYLKRRKTLAG